MSDSFDKYLNTERRLIRGARYNHDLGRDKKIFIGVSLLLFVNNIDVCFGLCEYYYHETDCSIPDYDTYNSTQSTLDIQSVFTDLLELLLINDSRWPADSFDDEESYSGLCLHLAWRADTDGEGGVAGGRFCYPPESSLMNNVTLDYARALVGGTKEKYGDALSDVSNQSNDNSICNIQGTCTACTMRICTG